MLILIVNGETMVVVCLYIFCVEASVAFENIQHDDYWH